MAFYNRSTSLKIIARRGLGIFSLTNGSKGTLAQLNTTGSPLYTALNSFITNNETSIANKPKAYLNWMLLDEQFNYVNTLPSKWCYTNKQFSCRFIRHSRL